MTPARPTPTTDHLRSGSGRTTISRRRPRGADRVAPLSGGRTRRPSDLRHRRTATRVGAGAITAVALMTGTAILDVSGAGAATVPYAVGFEDSGAPAIAPGDATRAYLDCPGAVAAVPVTVTDPSNDVSAYEETPFDSAGTPRVMIEVGSDADDTFAASELGTWSVSVACPGFDPFVTSFQVVSPTLDVSVQLDRDYDCSTTEPAYLPGDRERACLVITNNTGMDLRRIGALTATSGGFTYPAAGEVGPGETYVTAVSAGDGADLDGGSLDGLRVWAELGSSGSGVFAVSDTQSLAYGPLGAPIGLTATTGLSADTACADQGGLVDRTVDPGTPVYLCYTMTNTSGVTYHSHDIDDSVLGPLYVGLENDVDTYQTMSWSPSQPLVVTGTEIHTGTWSSTFEDPEGYIPLPDGYVAVAQATATITVTAAPTPPTTTPPTTTPTSTTPTTTPVVQPAVVAPYVAATPVAATPRFTG